MPSKKTAKPAPEDWMSRIKESSHDVFLAGLASLARARAPGKPSGKSDFDTLIAEGRKLEPGFGTGRGERIESHCSRPSKSDAASARVRP